MLFLPAAALCCLCSALAAMAQQLIQDQLSLTRRVNESVSFSCGGTQGCGGNYVFWYQKKDTETFTRILRFDESNGQVYKGYNHPQVNDFIADKNQNGCELQINKVKLLHSATYYCACDKQLSGGNWYFIFGSGTKLFVTDEQVVRPVVNIYTAASRARLECRSSLLCVASAMSPPLVRFSWKRRKEDGRLEELPHGEGEQLELRKSRCAAAILSICQQDSSTYKYICSVQHEGGTVEAEEGEVLAPTTSAPSPTTVPTTAPSSPTSAPTSIQPTRAPSPPAAAASFQSQCRVKLLCVQYTVLIVKSLLFCCGLSLLMILTNKPPSTSCTHAD